MPVVRAGCGSSRVLSRQYVRDHYWTAETTELGRVEGQRVAQQDGGDVWRAHVLITGTPTVHHTRPHVPHYHCVFTARAFPCFQAPSSPQQRESNPPPSTASNSFKYPGKQRLG